MEYARSNKKRIARNLTDRQRYPSETHPVSVFMAGSPGAGKTEFSKQYLHLLQESSGFEILRIDPDDYRGLIPGYVGDNSWLVQGAVTIITEKVLDLALEQKQSFLLDGTFADWPKSKSNISRCLGRGRDVEVLYVYQPPEQAWRFVQAREAQEGRMVPFTRFVDIFFRAHEAVKAALQEFGENIRVQVLVKPIDNGRHVLHSDVSDLDKVLRISMTRDLRAMPTGAIMKQHAHPTPSVSETRFAHFTRSASHAERQSLLVRAMRAATEDQRKVIKAYEAGTQKLAAR